MKWLLVSFFVFKQSLQIPRGIYAHSFDERVEASNSLDPPCRGQDEISNRPEPTRKVAVVVGVVKFPQRIGPQRHQILLFHDVRDKDSVLTHVPTLIHPYRPRLVQQIEAITAPAAFLGCRRQTSFYRIAVHIPQFLYTFLVRPNIEVIEAGL